MREPDREGIDGIVEILLVGMRDTRRRQSDARAIVHHLFGVENPPSDHLKPPCCEGGLPDISEDEVIEFMGRLTKLLARYSARDGWPRRGG